jgi:hypothetical protein
MAPSKDRQSLDQADPTPSQAFLDSLGSSLEVAIDTGDYALLLLEQDLSHHSLVLMVQEMTMKYRHTLNDGVGKVQDDIDGATIRNVHGIQPRGVRERDAIFCISEEVDLVYVERMQFGG